MVCTFDAEGPWPIGVGYHADEGSRYLTITKNVFTGSGTWGHANANHDTGDLTVTNNRVSGGGKWVGKNNTASGNVTISETLPADAQTVISAAGLEAACSDLKTPP